MKFRISQEDLTAGLAIVARAVSGKNTIPVLSGILLVLQGDRLTLRATDLELAIESHVPAQGEVDGSIVLPARYLTDLVRRIPAGQLECTVDPRNFTATLRWAKSQYVIHGFDAEQFPFLPAPEESQGFTVSQPLLRDMLRQTTFAASHDETRPWLTGVQLKTQENHLFGLATDGVRIAHSQMNFHDGAPGAISVIVPSRSLNELNRLLTGGPDETIRVTVTANQIFFNLGKIQLVSRLLEGQYPDVLRLVPQQFQSSLTVDRVSFVEALERAALIARDGAIKLSLTEGQLVITSNTPEVGQVYEELRVEYSGGPLDIGFNSRYLLEGLRSIDEEAILFEFSGSRNPSRLRGTTSQNYLYVVLPLITF